MTAYELRISDWSSDVCSSDLPFARAMKRFSVGPSSTMMVVTFSSSTSAPWLFSALAIADSTTLRIMWAAFLSENLSRLTDRKSVVAGKSVSVRLDHCGRRIIKQKNKYRLIHFDINQHN